MVFASHLLCISCQLFIISFSDFYIVFSNQNKVIVNFFQGVKGYETLTLL